jgi:hypothetical protein
MQLVSDFDFCVESTNEIFGLPAGAKGVCQSMLDDCDLGNSDRLSPIDVPQEVMARRSARLQGKGSGSEWELGLGSDAPHDSEQALACGEGAADISQAKDSDDEDAAPFRSLEELILDAESRHSFVGVPRAATKARIADDDDHVVPSVAPPAAPTKASSGEAEELRREILALRGTINALNNRLEGVCAMSAISGPRQPRVLDLSAAALTNVYPFSQQLAADSSDVAPAAVNDAVRSDVIRQTGREGAKNSNGDRGLVVSRHEHYRREVQSFYEAVFKVRASLDEELPSGAKVAGASAVPHGVDPVTYNISRQLLYEKLQNLELMLRKFHGFEEDLFRLLRAKYNTPLYRFEHF